MGLGAETVTNSNFLQGEKYFLENKGRDYIGIFENFQYHDQVIKEKQLALTNSDKFFRQSFGPMHLMDFKFFNNLVDDFIKWAKK